MMVELTISLCFPKKLIILSIVKIFRICQTMTKNVLKIKPGMKRIGLIHLDEIATDNIRKLQNLMAVCNSVMNKGEL